MENYRLGLISIVYLPLLLPEPVVTEKSVGYFLSNPRGYINNWHSKDLQTNILL